MISLILPFSLVLAQSAPQLDLPRHPALSPDGTQVAFSHQGDIWIAGVSDGQAKRLTAHDAYDGWPHWSPNGLTIAFVSRRHGNYDIFSIPSTGGAVQRHTWHSDNEKLHGWLDNDRMLIGAQRDRRYSRRDNGAWVAYRDGRTPTVLGDWAMLRPHYSASLNKLFYERGHGDPRRRGYRGAASSALWSYDFVNDSHKPLTEFAGNDLMPQLGSDGRMLFFLSDRESKNNIDGRELGLWRIPVVGGSPELVYHPGGQSLRNLQVCRSKPFAIAELGMGLCLINLQTGKATELKVYGGLDPVLPRYRDINVSGGVEEYAISKNGESIAFVCEGDIFLMRNHNDIKRAQRLTSSAALDSNPVFLHDDKTLLFLSERDGNSEIYRIVLGEGERFYTKRDFVPERMTETEEDEKSLTLSPDGKQLAWVRGLGKLQIGSLVDFEAVHTVCDGFDSPSYMWSPDSRWLAYSVADDNFNLDVFVANIHEKTDPVNISKHPDDDYSPIWSPDGRKILFTSRRMMLDETDVWVAFLKSEDYERTERERLEASELKEEKEKKVKEEKKKQAKEDAVLTGVWRSESAVLDIRLRSGEVIGVYKLGDFKMNLNTPLWDSVGKTLSYSLSEEGTDQDSSSYILTLSDGELVGEGLIFKRDKESKSELPKEEVEPEFLVSIDFDGLNSRIVKKTRREGNETAVGWGKDSEVFYFNATLGTRLTTGTTANLGFYKSNIYKSKDSEVENNSVYDLVHHDGSVYCRNKGQIYKGVEKGEKIAFSVSYRRDTMAVRGAVINQAWRVLDRNFYDEGFHGHDWVASLDKWRPIAMLASTPEDYGEMVNYMLGEMNASHMGYYSFGSSAAKVVDSPGMGWLGVLWSEESLAEGRKIKEVLQDTPASRFDSKLNVGDIVLSVNGLEYKQGDNWSRLMLGTSGEEIYLEVLGSNDIIRSVIIRPTSSISDALYKREELNNRRYVESKSGDRLGYLHIESMSTGPLLDFQRKLFAATEGKEALLIDVRENGGGWTTDMLLTMLTTSDHAYTIPRGGGKGYPQGRRIFATWNKPVVVLCNENSYSNAEIFSWSIKTLNRGPVVGKTTYGAVISTGGFTLLDGSFVRMPFRGWYVNDDKGTNMEWEGCPPDYPVENLPGDFAKKVDRQLDKAIQVGLGLL